MCSRISHAFDSSDRIRVGARPTLPMAVSPTSPSRETDLPEIAQRSRHRLLDIAEGVEIGQRSERQTGLLLDGADRDLRRLVPPEDELLFADEILLRHRVAGGAELPRVVVHERDDLPESHRNLDAEVHRIVRVQEWPGKDGDSHVVLTGMIERVVLQPQPDAGIE